MADANLTAAKARREAWVRETLPGAVAYAASLLRDRQAADDVVHDCYCRLLQKADVYDLDRDGTKILFRSISNACINRNTREHPHIPLDDPERSGPSLGLVDRKAEDPAEVSIGRELERAVGDALGRLPLTQRAALELKSLGHTTDEIALALAVTPTHAGVLIHRARQALAVSLRPILGERV